MTQMQSPYQESSDVTMYAEPERTSIMAILSMIFGIGGCCLGVTSIPALLLGVFGLIGISKSKGRVGGTGFSIAGILVGLVSLAIWVGIFFGGSHFVKYYVDSFGAPIEQVLLDIQADNFDSARGQMDSPASDVPDEEFVVFREAYSATLGKIISKPDGLGDLISGYKAIAPLIQPYSGQPGYIPMPMHFDSGWGLVFYVMDMQAKSNGVPKPIGFIVIDQQGNEYHLPMVQDETAPDVDSDAQTPDVPGLPGEPIDKPSDEAGGDEGP